MGWQVLSAYKVPQSLFLTFPCRPGQGDGLASASKVLQSLCLNFSVQALAKVMGWQVLSASKVPHKVFV
jgi:hypothetical protein